MTEHIPAALRPANPRLYRSLLAATDGTLRNVVRLHAPRWGGWWHCEGCDLGPHPLDSPDWPCSTVELIAAEVGLTTSEGDTP